MTATVVSCTKAKLSGIMPAGELYSASPRFKRWLARAVSDGHPVFILSTKYGLVRPEQRIAPYELDIGDMSQADLTAWQERLRRQVRLCVTDAGITRAVFLASKRYREAAKPAFVSEGVQTYVHRHWNVLSR